jgi:hypothetical protein
MVSYNHIMMFSDYVYIFTGLVGGVVQTGVDQFVNNEINSHIGGGLGSGAAYENNRGGGGGFF